MTISAWRVRRFPENARYIQSWDRNAWSMLEQFDELGSDETARRFGAPDPTPSTSDLIARRAEVFGTALTPLTYSTPLHLVRGHGVWLEDVDGRRYLDAYNNVPVVGHAHPRVANAIADQARLLNTNLRYLHPKAIELAERLVASMPEGSGLDTVLFVNAGSEATDLAWRLATVATGNDGGPRDRPRLSRRDDGHRRRSPRRSGEATGAPTTWSPSRPPVGDAPTAAPVREAIERLAGAGTGRRP